VESKDLQTPVPLAVKQLKDTTQGHLDDARKVDGAELHQVQSADSVLGV
jgi:hypothetical protein